MIDKRKFEWNLNTLISLVTLMGMIFGGVYYWANTVRDLEELKKWQENHDKVTEGRLIENRTLRGQTEERLKSIERDATVGDRTQDQIQYRVTVLESSLAIQTQQSQKIDDKLSELSGDVKLVKELLQRQEAANKRTIR